jgi:hypothetical protein
MNQSPKAQDVKLLNIVVLPIFENVSLSLSIQCPPFVFPSLPSSFFETTHQ